MPNDTLAANAAPMPTRRVALSSILGAGAILAAPAAVALAAHADAELLALQPEIDAADRAFDVVLSNLSCVQERFYELRDKLRLSQKPISPADPEWDQALADFEKKVAAIRDRGIQPEMAAYDEAVERQKQAESEARVESGLEDAEREEREKSDAVTEIKERLLATKATTLAGLIFKARYARAHYSPGDYDLEVMISIVDDLLDMAGEA
jgi:hypothetical protein